MTTLPELLNALLPFDNLLAWFVQVVILVGASAVAVLALRHPRARLLFWHGVLTAAVLLPFLEPRRQAPSPAPAPAKVVNLAHRPTALPAVAVARSPFDWRPEYLVWILAAGALLRLVWIAAGLARLRNYCRDARRVPSPIPFEGANASWYVSDRVAGPVTFGWIKPAILLPSHFLDFEPEVREAIASHELIHVLRHDWLYVIAGELVRCTLWFHPAIWYVLGQVQLAREQVVDLEAVRLTRKRRSYLDALVAVAARSLQPDVAPAPLFLKKRQLAVRVAAVLKENSMSMPRIVASLTAVTIAAVAAVALAVWIFPMQAHAQETRSIVLSGAMDSAGIVVEAGGTLLHRNGIMHPRGVNVTGTVVIEASLNQKGEVIDARVLSGPNELRRSALESVLGWHYATDTGAPPMLQISIHFNQAPPQIKVVPPVPASVRGGFNPMTIRDIEFSGITPSLERQLSLLIGVRPGDLLTSEAMHRITDAAHEIDEHIQVSLSQNTRDERDKTASLRLSLGPQIPSAIRGGIATGNPGAVGVISGTPGGVPGGIPGGVTGGIASSSALPPPPDGGQRVRVGGNVQAATPLYPPLAKQARIQGVVRFDVIIAADGSVKHVQLISGHPLMVQNAMDAVQQWLYKPTLLNGSPVEVVTTVDVNFTLSEEFLQ